MKSTSSIIITGELNLVMNSEVTWVKNSLTLTPQGTCFPAPTKLTEILIFDFRARRHQPMKIPANSNTLHPKQKIPDEAYGTGCCVLL